MTSFQPSKKTSLNDKIVISIRLEETKLKQIDKIADKTNISRNELINQCLDYALENISFDKEDDLEIN